MFTADCWELVNSNPSLECNSCSSEPGTMFAARLGRSVHPPNHRSWCRHRRNPNPPAPPVHHCKPHIGWGRHGAGMRYPNQDLVRNRRGIAVYGAAADINDIARKAGVCRHLNVRSHSIHSRTIASRNRVIVVQAICGKPIVHVNNASGRTNERNGHLVRTGSLAVRYGQAER